MAELARQVEELEEVRRQQSHKISALKEEIACSEGQTQEKRLVADNAVQALSSELRTTKNALDSMKYREKQVRAQLFSCFNHKMVLKVISALSPELLFFYSVFFKLSDYVEHIPDLTEKKI